MSNSLFWWQLPIPPKLRIFTWLLHRNKILTKDNLTKKGCVGSTKCCFCTNEESVTHLFFLCPFVKKIWFWAGLYQHELTKWRIF